MDVNRINKILEQHKLWLDSDGREGSQANLEGANLEGVNLQGANLERANLEGANLYGVNLTWANLTWANLTGADLTGSHLTRANLIAANLSSANLSFTFLCRADMTMSNLHRANLNGANLRGTIGNMEHVKSIFCETYYVTYTAEVMQIGCERHKIEDWWNFDDAQILKMDGKTALKWWRTWKPVLQQIIEASSATATGYEGNSKN